jgi:beta-glucanase (GH16 family)
MRLFQTKLIVLSFLLIIIFAANRHDGKAMFFLSNKETKNIQYNKIVGEIDKNESNWYLAWSDEFDYEGLPDSTKWGYDIGGHGWGNNEQQFYTFKDTLNAKVENGFLKIIARKQNKENRQYTSARLLTKGKADFKYGKIDIKAKLPGGKGVWPALWMLGDNISEAKWPLCGEVDIMEHVGHMPDSIFGSVHTKDYNHVMGTQNTKGIFIKNPYGEFHNYSIEWTPEKIEFFVDGKRYNYFINEKKGETKWPFDQKLFLILNVAIGGNWGGQFGVDDNICPATMEVDYVRVYQKKVY